MLATPKWFWFIFLKINFKVITPNSPHKSSVLKVTREIKVNKRRQGNSYSCPPQSAGIKQTASLSDHSPLSLRLVLRSLACGPLGVQGYKGKHLGDPCSADTGYQDFLGGAHLIDGDIRDLQCMARTGHENMLWIRDLQCIACTGHKNMLCTWLSYCFRNESSCKCTRKQSSPTSLYKNLDALPKPCKLYNFCVIINLGNHFFHNFVT